MKILWFTWKDRDNPLAGGAEVVNEELAARLVNDGHEVVFIVGGFKGSTARASRRGFQIVRVGSRYTSYLAAFREYRRNWRDWPELVIDECNTMPYFASLYTSGRQVMFFHMLCRQIWFYEFPPALNLLGWLAEPMYLRICNRNQWVIVVSESTKNDLLRMGYRDRQISIIAEGIEMSPVPDLSAVKKFDRPTVLSLGAMRSMKQTIDQVKAFELAKQKIPDLRLVMAGDTSGVYGQKVLAYTKKSPWADAITQSGYVTKVQKQHLMQRAHVLVSTAVKEGWGLTITEAASQGTPAVVYDVDGLRDSVRQNQTGVITTQHPKAMAEAIVDLISDKPRYERLAAAGWEWARELTFERSYEQFKEVIAHA